MEEILNKNIFDDKVLLKLSPDYVPTNTLLRLQFRRNMVKDTHIHNTFTYNHGQRKTAKLSKDRVKMNKEIEELRQSFQNMNLRNEIMLKNNNAENSQYKTKENPTSNVQHIPEIDKISSRNSEFVYDESKGRLNGYKGNIRNKNLNRHHDLKSIQNNNEELNEISEERTISVEYKYYEQVDNNEGNIPVEELEETPEHNDLSITNSRQLTLDTQMSDLQSVLIMMAINSNSNENEHTNSNRANDDIIQTSENPEDLVIVSNPIPLEVKPEFLNITPLRVIVTDRQKIIMTKYIKKWRNYVNKRRAYIAQQRQEAINNFFEKLEKKKNEHKNPHEEPKSKMLARDYSTYQHRYKMQKHIIALQKAKLEEQSRVIDELKYNKIIEASKQSVDAMKEEVRRTYFELDRHLKPKIKLLTNELKIPEIEGNVEEEEFFEPRSVGVGVQVGEPSLVLHCLKVPQFLQRMEKRAREREEKHAMIRERRRQMEEERVRLKQQAELAKLEMDKEEKMKRIKELREKRKRDRIESIRKKQYADRMRSLTVMADLHYERTLMAKYCIKPLKTLMAMKRDNLEKAKAHYKFQLKKNVFLHWMFYTEDMWMERNYRAEKFYRTKMQKLVFEAFKKNHHEYVLKKQVAEDYYDLYASQLVFRKLREGIAIIKKENEIKMEIAVLYHNRNLQFRTLTSWRTLPALNALKREQEARKARWREKVLQVVPDYSPPDE